MNNNSLKVEVQSNAPLRRIDFYLVEIAPLDGTTMHLGQPVTMEAVNLDDPVALPPTFSLSLQSAQAFMDALWGTGIRPTENGSAGQLDAMKAHLEDMRRLVFEGVKHG